MATELHQIPRDIPSKQRNNCSRKIKLCMTLNILGH